MKPSPPYRVIFDEQGRDGYVHYEEGETRLSFYWALGGGNVAASISVGDEAEWRAARPHLLARRGEIIARIMAAAIAERAPTCRGEIDETGRFINLVSDKPLAAPAPGAEDEAKAFFWRYNKVKSQMAMIVLVLIVIALGALIAGRGALTIKTTGTPIGASARAGDFIATPIGRLEPYVPSLDRNHGNDKYSIGLLIHSARDEKIRRYVEAAKGQSGSVFGVVKITGASDGFIFFDAPESVVVDVSKARLLSAEEAVRIAAPERPKGAAALVALATAERRLEGFLAAPGEDGAPTALDVEGDIHDLKFLRASSYGPLLAADGDLFAIFRTRPYQGGVLEFARVSASGAVLWRTQTPLGALDEALPDAALPVLVGARPREEGKVPEPLLIVIDAETGAATAHSLLVE